MQINANDDNGRQSENLQSAFSPCGDMDTEGITATAQLVSLLFFPLPDK